VGRNLGSCGTAGRAEWQHDGSLHRWLIIAFGALEQLGPTLRFLVSTAASGPGTQGKQSMAKSRVYSVLGSWLILFESWVGAKTTKLW
jgi:hypothetical protein